jgi:hypothetical protein
MEAVTLVCDYGDGRSDVEQVTIRVGGRSLVIDLCQQHLKELTAHARAPKRGRKPKIGITPSSNGRRRGRPKASTKRTAGKISAKKAATRKRRSPNK